MKKRMILLAIIMLLTLTMSTAVRAQVIRTPFTGVGAMPEILEEGTWSFPGDNVHFRDRVEFFSIESTDARTAGWQTVFANANLNADGYGPVWGTFRTTVVAYDGYWEGSYTGVVDENGLSLKMRGRGFGDLSGLRIEGTYLNGVTYGLIIESPND